ncbi:head-tail joining protein [Roseovarius sp. D0-M9]|uniref:head-tail joining protein n=1 Tax=Roseovarius sp. D0-M9 TaxID=3127117 RepID=UPI0030101328
MPSPSWENLDAFLQLDEFAVTAIVTPAEGVSRSIVGIFDDPFLDAQLGEYRLDTSAPRFQSTEQALSGIKRGDGVTIDGVEYIALGGPKSDGTGMATLELVKQEAGGAAF